MVDERIRHSTGLRRSWHPASHRCPEMPRLTSALLSMPPAQILKRAVAFVQCLDLRGFL